MRVTRIRTNATGRPPSAIPREELWNTGPKRRGSPIPIILVLLVLGAGGYFGWKAFESRRAAERARAAEYQKWLAEREQLRHKRQVFGRDYSSVKVRLEFPNTKRVELYEIEMPGKGKAARPAAASSAPLLGRRPDDWWAATVPPGCASDCPEGTRRLLSRLRPKAQGR